MGRPLPNSLILILSIQVTYSGGLPPSTSEQASSKSKAEKAVIFRKYHSSFASTTFNEYSVDSISPSELVHSNVHSELSGQGSPPVTGIRVKVSLGPATRQLLSSLAISKSQPPTSHISIRTVSLQTKPLYSIICSTRLEDPSAAISFSSTRTEVRLGPEIVPLISSPIQSPSISSRPSPSKIL